MTQEEKAKRYDEAVCKMKEIITMDNTPTIPREIGEYLFPELKESEDEKIKKEIINYINFADSNNLLRIDDYEKKKGWIAWLEKQSTPQVRTGLEWVNTIDDACDKRYAEEYAHGEYCHEQSFKWGFQEGVDWLEKQGEPTDINPSEFDLRLNKLLKQFETLPNEELEEYAQRESELFGEREYEVDSLDRNALRKGFYCGCKAGAEWMASHGKTAEVGYWNQRGLSLLLDKPLEKLGYKEGDKVIIQIRKK